jgi:hypothetical protein
MSSRISAGHCSRGRTTTSPFRPYPRSAVPSRSLRSSIPGVRGANRHMARLPLSGRRAVSRLRSALVLSPTTPAAHCRYGSCHVRVPLMPGQHAQQDRSQNVLLGWGISAPVISGHSATHFCHSPFTFRNSIKVRHRPECSHRRVRIPPDKTLASQSVKRFSLIYQS